MDSHDAAHATRQVKARARPPVPGKRRRGLRGIVPALVFLFALAPLLAAGLLPDPTWMGGIFDGADEDTLLALVLDHAPAVASGPVPARLLDQAQSPSSPDPAAPRSLAAPSSEARAPPAG